MRPFPSSVDLLQCRIPRRSNIGKRDHYEPGAFCWIDLATTDTKTAKSFYGELFGWESVDEGGGYSMMQLNGDAVCGIFDMDGQMKSRNVRPYWQSYVSVEEARTITQKVEEIGGEILEGPFEIPGSGRTAVVRDPEGTVVPLWEPKEHIGSARVNEPGCFTWNELQTRSPAVASEFYAGLFGWDTKPVVQHEEVVYVTIENGGSANGGMMPMTKQHGDAPAGWLVYFTTSDIDGTVERTEGLGGEVMAGPMEVMPGSRIAVVRDPQGATFALFEGEVDD